MNNDIQLYVSSSISLLMNSLSSFVAAVFLVITVSVNAIQLVIDVT